MIKNLTPHPIVFRPAGTTGETDRVFPPTGVVPRVGTIETQAGPVDGLPCITSTLGQVEGLPAPQAVCPRCGDVAMDLHGLYGPGSCPDCGEGTAMRFYIVSRMVFDACPERRDLICPDTGRGAVRDEAGRIVAVTRFIRRG